MLDEAKEKDWQDFVHKNNTNNPCGDVFKICMGKREIHNIAILKKPEFGWTNSWIEIAQVLITEFSPEMSNT